MRDTESTSDSILLVRQHYLHKFIIFTIWLIFFALQIGWKYVLPFSALRFRDSVLCSVCALSIRFIWPVDIFWTTTQIFGWGSVRAFVARPAVLKNHNKTNSTINISATFHSNMVNSSTTNSSNSLLLKAAGDPPHNISRYEMLHYELPVKIQKVYRLHGYSILHKMVPNNTKVGNWNNMYRFQLFWLNTIYKPITCKR